MCRITKPTVDVDMAFCAVVTWIVKKGETDVHIMLRENEAVKATCVNIFV